MSGRGRGALAALLAGAALLGPGPAGAETPLLREDRIRFFIHDRVADQLDAADLAVDLEQVRALLQGSQDLAVDVPTCVDLVFQEDPPVLTPTHGALPDELAVIESREEFDAVVAWARTQWNAVGVFVEDLQWCGVPTNAIGCANTPGSVFLIAVDTPTVLRPVVIAHERLHNARVFHREDDDCALMQPFAASDHGCLNQPEADAFPAQAFWPTSESCDCIDLETDFPVTTWSVAAQGQACDDGDACTELSTCDAGQCLSALPPCFDGLPCTQDLCQPGTGCSHPVLPNGTSCDLVGDVCAGIDRCVNGACVDGPPLACDDGLFCNGAESCHPAAGCLAGVAPDPADDVDCTLDVCDETADLVRNLPDHEVCDDGDPCTAESCDAVHGCVTSPVAFCTPTEPIPALGGAGGVWLAGALLAVARVSSRSARARWPRCAASTRPARPPRTARG